MIKYLLSGTTVLVKTHLNLVHDSSTDGRFCPASGNFFVFIREKTNPVLWNRPVLMNPLKRPSPSKVQFTGKRVSITVPLSTSSDQSNVSVNFFGKNAVKYTH